MISILKIFNSPIIRHITAGIIILGIGFYFGNSLFRDKLKEARKNTNEITGKYKQLNKSYELLKNRTDTLQKVVVELAKIERIKVDNHITDTKVKRGSTLNFVPKTDATIRIEQKDSIVPFKKERKRGFFKRIFFF